MKKLSIILFLCVSVCSYIFGGPAYPGPYLIIQPNGDSIYVYYHGDERSRSYHTDKKGNRVAENGAGYWVYVANIKGRHFLTDQIVSKTSTFKEVDEKTVLDYWRKTHKRKRGQKGELFKYITLNNQLKEYWINPKIKWSDIKDHIGWCNTSGPSWLVRKTEFGRHDFSCLLLYTNDSTNEYYFVNHYMDFSTRLKDTNEVVSVVDVYRCYAKSIDGGAILSSNFYKQINIPQNKKLRKRINKINEIFNKKYQQIDELVGLTQERNEKYRCSSYSSCEDCEEFFKTHTLVDVIGSFVKNPVAEYPIDDEIRIK